MNEWIIALVSALWLGLLTSISPCPLATNIAAISFLGRRVQSPGRALLGGLLYVAGRSFFYVALAIILIAGLLEAPAVSRFLQKYMNQLLGPVLILAGMFLLEMLGLSLPGAGRASEKLQARIEKGGVYWGAAALGVLFAAAFCPVSAALYFGSLIPLAVKMKSTIGMPLLYGAGTALPVVVFAALIALGAKQMGLFFNRLTQFEKFARIATGVLFILAGFYLSLTYIFGIRIL